MKKRPPIGIENFEEIIEQNFYYVDKTMFIAGLLNNWGKVNLFTRPRRFGKTLNMSMLKYFFEIGTNTELFAGLKISQESKLCEKYMGKFPVISISLKGVEGLNFGQACAGLRNVIGKEALKFQFLKESDRLTEEERKSYAQLIRVGDGYHAIYEMSDGVMVSSLQTLSQLLAKHYGQKTILLIDEYDVPLDKAFQNGYYDEMIELIRGLLGNVVKTNDSLYFSVLTGCMRISKESIFTGLNNLKVHTIADVGYDEFFGFTNQDVSELLNYFDLSSSLGTMREWYDGYQFGNISVYCPWDVINYCEALRTDSKALPQNYWSNTSGNKMVRRFIDKADQQTRNEIEQLIAGKIITKNINMELTYNELDETIENLWSVLFTTGYLTQKGRTEDGLYRLSIPNREIQSLFLTQIQAWFKETTRKDANQLAAFCTAFLMGDAALAQKLLSAYLWKTISIRDTFISKKKKENFYHGMLLGLLQYMDNWLVKSNAESGEGFSDILIETPELTGVVIEVKYADDGNLEAGCTEALEQIERQQYASRLEEDGMETIKKYGIAFYKKRCKVRIG
ncbi:MAG: AAA family ATPase [Lachnospiraceae bacterium]|nr:AAA family ATPase [Lachnospiraceae bacterium]